MFDTGLTFTFPVKLAIMAIRSAELKSSNNIFTDKCLNEFS